jgi:hypothetical protein
MTNPSEWFDSDREPDDEEAREPTDIPEDRIYYVQPGEAFRGIWSRDRFNAIWHRIISGIHAKETPAPVWYRSADEGE